MRAARAGVHDTYRRMARLLKPWAALRAGRLTAYLVPRLDRILARSGWRVVPNRQVRRLEEAERYAFYWHKARKRVEIRELDGFGRLAAAAVAEHRTGMREDRLYSLWQAVAMLPPGNRPIAEVGAYRGGSARFLGEALQWHGRANQLYVCDTFSGHVVVDEELDGPHRVGEQFVNTSYEDVSGYLADLPGITLVQGDFREASERLAPAAPFAFAHLDVDVYPVMRHALEFFAPRLLPRAIMVVDDYGFETCRGTRQAVHEFVEAHEEYLMFHLLTGQALLVRRG